MLVVGDILFFFAALYSALYFRILEAPSWEMLVEHAPFVALFALWILVFFVFDLYGQQTATFKRRIVSVLFWAQAVNAVIAVIFFYLAPVAIAPKTTLLYAVALAFLFVAVWRIYLVNFVYVGRTQRVAIFGDSPEIRELTSEIRANKKYRIEIVDEVRPKDVGSAPLDMVIAELSNTRGDVPLRELYPLVFRGVQCVDTRDLYEQIFDRVPLELLEEGWFLQNIARRNKRMYDVVKRVMDFVIALPLFLVTLLLYPFVVSAIKLDDDGPIFVTQTRIGQHGEPITIKKFRSMTTSDVGAAVLHSTGHVTPVGRVLRRTRIDELPQLVSVIAGDMSLVGPRPELPALAEVYSKEIPYYDIRHIIKPGLSGWAQIYHDEHPHHGTSVAETKNKLSYDLFYVKHRSLWLDLKIALKTVKKLLSFAGK